jgi:predicted ribosomally synthesized peptide with SipW-like signal peptide
MNILTTLRHAKTRNKVMAIASAGLIVGVGTAMTLATWTDTEWDFAGAGGVPGLGTSTFVVQQNASNPYVAGNFASFNTAPGNALTFSPGALTLSPGDTVAAPVALETTNASVAGTLQLQPAVASGVAITDPGGLLAAALVVGVGWVSVAPGTAVPACTALPNAYTAIPMTGTGLGATPVAVPQNLLASKGNVLHYCFTITLPAGSPTTLQGRTVSPAWSFLATSN